MVEVTQADRDCRNAIYRELTGFNAQEPEASQYDWMDKYIATHRIVERERCARVAEEFDAWNSDDQRQAIAQAIRSGE